MVKSEIDKLKSELVLEILQPFEVSSPDGPVWEMRSVDWDPESNLPSIHLVKFLSDSPRKDLEELHSLELKESERESINTLIDRNENFPLRVYLPPKPPVGKKRYDSFYLVLNGLGESEPTIYDEMCLDIATRHRKPVVFLPLPLHYCRHHEFKPKGNDLYEPFDKNWSIITSQRIFQSIMHSPERLFYSYLQTLDEIDCIVDMIGEGGHPYWSMFFSDRSRMSLFGYSFGGFSALAYLLLSSGSDKKVSLDKVFLFESGGFIDLIDASVLFHRHDSVALALWEHYYVDDGRNYPWEPLFSPTRDAEQMKDFAAAFKERREMTKKPGKHWRPEAFAKKVAYKEPYRVMRRKDEVARELWRDVMESLYVVAKESSEDNQGRLDAEKDLFKQIYLGYERIGYRRRIEVVQDKILIISGGADEIFPTSSLLELGPDSGLALLQVPGITHWVKHRSKHRWRQWQQMVVDIMETFVTGGGL